MAKIKWNPSTLLAPVPAVAVTCASGESDDIVTVAWTGIICSNPAKTYISLRPERYSHGLISESREFAVNLTTGAMVRAVDMCGVRSGRDCDKFEVSGLAREAAQELSCPIIAQSPLSIECRVTDIIKLGSHDMFIADIVAVDVDESLLDGAGKLHLERAGLVAYTHGEYYALGKKIGNFGFSVRKKRTKKQENKR